MTVHSYRMGPGTLTLGSSPLDASAQLTSCTVSADENVDTEDAVDVLSGERLDAVDDVTLGWTIAGTILQDLATAGLVSYTWSNASDEVPFVFVPNTAAGRRVTGTCRLIPLAVGGAVKSRPTSDFSWVVIGTPVLGDVGP